MAEGFDSIMTLLPVSTLATNGKSSGGGQLEEDSNSKAMSILDGSAKITETRKERKSDYCESLYYQDRRSIGAARKLCNGTHVVVDTSSVKIMMVSPLFKVIFVDTCKTGSGVQ
jgi:hypothetical protein